MIKRILTFSLCLLLVFSVFPMMAFSTVSAASTWSNGGISVNGVDGYSDMGYGFTKLSVTDARGSIAAPNLDEAPYYMLLGMDGLLPGGGQATGGRWAQLHISPEIRNCNWTPNDEIYIIFPNSFANPRNITIKNSTYSGVPFMPNTAYVFKFAKEKNSDNEDTLVIYCNGTKVFEGKDQLRVFGGSALWFTTMGNQAEFDTFKDYPLFINPETGITKDNDVYFTTGPKTGCNGYSQYVDDVVADNMTALYDDNGYARAIVDCAHNDGGWPERVGESVCANFSNENKSFELSAICDRLVNGNWSTIGIYDPSTGEKSFAQSANVIRLTLTGNTVSRLSFSYLNGEGAVKDIELIRGAGRVVKNEKTKIRFELVEGSEDKINIYFNDVIVKTVKESDENTAELFNLMNAEQLRVGIVGNKGAGKEPNVIRFNVDNGNSLQTKLALDKEIYETGDYVTATATLTNKSGKEINGISLTAVSSAQLVPVNGNSESIPSLAAGASVTVTKRFRAIEGGRPMLRVKVTYNGDEDVFDSKQFVSINGAGWYEGDAHTHSTYSDGSGTVAQNSAASYERGFSWLYSTDHNSISQWHETAGINAFYSNGDFINIAGNEISSFNRGHSVGYRLPYNSGSNFSESENQPGWNIAGLGEEGLGWDDIIDSVKSMGGIIYVAHPNAGINQSANIYWSFSDVYNVENINGIEVWNAGDPITSLVNKGAFKIWDELNVRGDKIFGIANSDGHGTEPIGASHSKGYMTSLSEENINNTLENGSFFGTNGPDLFLEINGISMGGTLNISDDTGSAKITVKASDDNYPLTKVTLYKLHVTGEISPQAAEVIDTDIGNGRIVDGNLYTDTKEVVREWSLAGQNLYTFSDTVDVTVNDGDFYRMEVESEKNTNYDGYVAGANENIGFAFSNPVWVEKAQLSNDVGIESITLTSENAVLEHAVTGSYYIKMLNDNAFITTDNINIITSENAVLTSKSYDPINNKFDIVITAADGSTRTVSIYVVPEMSAQKAQWKNGGISKPASLNAGYSDFGYGFTRVTVADAHGSVTAPDLDKEPYYLMLGMDGLISGTWGQLHISSGERNCNWNPNNEIYISFPNDSTTPRNITVKNSTGGLAYNAGVTFIPQTTYIFKFAKEKDLQGTDVLVIYINGVKVFEGAQELQVFNGEKLWFTTMGGQGIKDTFTNAPLFINASSNMKEDPDFYPIAGPKGGHGGVSWFNVYGLLDENMLALYDDDGYSKVVVDSVHNDGGDPLKVGESVSVDMPNPNKQFEISVISDSQINGNWTTIGFYNPAPGAKSFAESENTLRLGLNGQGTSSLNYYYQGNKSISLIPGASRVIIGEINKIRFELIEGETDIINIYYNGELIKTVSETEENISGLFDLMNAETVRVGVVGNKGTDKEPNVIRFKLNNSSRSVGDVSLQMNSDTTLRLDAPTGLRFETKIYALDTLPSDAEYEIGTVIVPYSYISDGTQFTVDALSAAEKEYLDIKCSVWTESEDEAGTYRNIKTVISNIKQQNYNCDFAARSYIKITFGNGDERWIYSDFDNVNNVTSVSRNAHLLRQNTVEYNLLSNTQKAVVDDFANSYISQ